MNQLGHFTILDNFWIS